MLIWQQTKIITIFLLSYETELELNTQSYIQCPNICSLKFHSSDVPLSAAVY